MIGIVIATNLYSMNCCDIILLHIFDKVPFIYYNGLKSVATLSHVMLHPLFCIITKVLLRLPECFDVESQNRIFLP